MQKESISTKTFVKGIAAGLVVACSLGALQFAEYSTAKKAASHSFVPGTYTASAPGIESDVKVTITVDSSSITDVSVDVSGETPGLGADIGDEIISQIKEAQSSGIDGVAGCTITSTAAKEALDAAIVKAEAGEADEPEPETQAKETEAPEKETDAPEKETAAPETEAPAAEDTTEEAEPSAAGTNAAGAAYTPGTYSASAKGIESDVKVDVTVDESSITAVSIDVSGETAGIGAEIGETMEKAILDAQSVDVDGVAGATISSDAVKAAAAEALAQAGAGAAAADAAKVMEEAVSEAAGAMEEAVSEAADAVEEAVSEAAETVEEAAAGALDEAAMLYVPGTYSASAAGIESDVKVDVTVDESSITAVSIDVSGETAGIGAEIGDAMEKAIMDAQSADVDGVAGATISSDAVKAAAAEALAQAGAGAAAAEAVEEAVSEAAEALSEAAGASEEAAALYTPGTYTATAAGMESDVEVSITVDESSITKAAVDVSGETQGVGAAIGETMEKEIMDAQSADIDSVAGATVSSEAVKKAAEQALSEASGK